MGKDIKKCPPLFKLSGKFQGENLKQLALVTLLAQIPSLLHLLKGKV
jgi:hypothetical protein